MNSLEEILARDEDELLTGWLQAQVAAGVRREDLIAEEVLRRECSGLLRAFRDAIAQDHSGDITGPAWQSMRETLTTLSGTRAHQGFSPVEVATFMFTLKQPIERRLRQALGRSPERLLEDVQLTNALLDRIGLLTVAAAQKVREAIIVRQREEMIELSTPVVTLWEGILALPLIGTLDSERTQVVMETLLQRIVETTSTIAILDITGVPTVDTLVAQHLLRTVTAARLMGADCIISGIRPQIAQTIVHLGVQLGDVITKASLADAFAVALQRRGLTVVRRQTAEA